MPDTRTRWSIADLERRTADNAVLSVRYIVSISDDNHCSSIYGSIGLAEPDPKTMIPYEQLTESIVIDWAKNAIGNTKIAEIQKNLEALLNERLNPTKAAGLPWSVE